MPTDLFLSLLTAALAQGPANPHLADSTWPIYHADTSATATAVGPDTRTPSAVQRVPNLTDRRFGSGGVSPWTVLRAPDPDGSQVLLTTPLTGVAKYRIVDGRLVGVDFLDLDRDWADFDWSIAVLADGAALVTEQKHNRFAIVEDASPNPASDLRVRRRIPIPKARYGQLSTHFTVAFDGAILALTEPARLIAVSPASGQVLADLTFESDDPRFHNSFPVDATGRVFLSTQEGLRAVDWTGSELIPAWSAEYDMRGPGFDGAKTGFGEALAVAQGKEGTGTGTTPTLLGDPQTGVVVLVDGHSPANHLVAFWRDAIPADARRVPDPYRPGRLLDPRVAALHALPHSTPLGEGHTAENSPAAFGNAVVVAQWAGFKPDATPPTGVQRVDWDPLGQRFREVWANPDVLINGVPTIARSGDGHRVYGMGRHGPGYVYVGLDFETGERLVLLELGADDSVLDQGNNHVVAAEGSLVYPGKRELVRVFDPTDGLTEQGAENR